MKNRTIAVCGVLLCLGAVLFGFRPTGVAQTELEGSLNTASLNFDASYLDPLARGEQRDPSVCPNPQQERKLHSQSQ